MIIFLISGFVNGRSVLAESDTVCIILLIIKTFI